MNSTSKIEQIGQAMNCITLNNTLLDAALAEVDEQLVTALGGASSKDCLTDKDLNRASAASALGLVGALLNLKEPGDLEALMVGVDFLDDDDAEDAKLVKGVVLHCLLSEKIKGSSPLDVERLKFLLVSATEITQRYGYAGQYFPGGSLT